MSQLSVNDYIRHGQIDFFRLPRARVEEGSEASYAGAGAVLLGAPFDGGVTYQPGARFAPYHVRRVSALVESRHPVHRINVFETLRAIDGGNVPMSPFDLALASDQLEAEVARVVVAEAVPFVVGGDHSIALPILRALSARHGPVACVHVDAHFDMSGPETWGTEHHHGTVFRHALGEGLIATGQLYQLGLRSPLRSSDDGALAARHGVKMFRIEEVVERGVPRVMAELRESIGDRPTYVSFDIDAVDPAFAPGTGTPVPGGLSAREALGLVRGLAGVSIVGMDLVEVLPALDHADITTNLAAHLLYEGLTLLALRLDARRVDRASRRAVD